jgi:hypothetical protein
MVEWLKGFSSEYLGVCIDTGNSLALLEDPYLVVERLAPWAITTHLKDMAVAEYEEGFRLAEVPLGQGMLDIQRMVTTLRKAKPSIRLNLEMITRDPLKVPCLSDGYWSAMQSVPGSELAKMMTLVRTKQQANRMPSISKLDHAQQLRAEHEHILQSMNYNM